MIEYKINCEVAMEENLFLSAEIEIGLEEPTLEPFWKTTEMMIVEGIILFFLGTQVTR